MAKILQLLSTPIGNLEDISKRAHQTLLESDCLVCEDTRETKKLLELLDIPLVGKSFFAFHEHNQKEVLSLLEKVLNFEKAVLVSDAGSPLMSDPGFPFVKEWIERGGEVTSIPGASSVPVALELSGLPPIPFMFHGFIGKKKEARKKFFEQTTDGTTHIIFESPHRIKATIEDLFEVHANAKVAIARELTKKFEEVKRFSKSEWESEYKDLLKEKGEFVLVFHNEGSAQKKNSDKKALEIAKDYLNKPSSKKLAKLIASVTGDEISDIYDSLNR